MFLSTQNVDYVHGEWFDPSSLVRKNRRRNGILFYFIPKLAQVVSFHFRLCFEKLNLMLIAIEMRISKKER